MDHVLVGLDGSPESLAALRWGERFAAATARELHVVHCWAHGRPLEGPPAATDSGVDALEAQAVARMERLCRDALGETGVDVACRALRGSAPGALLKEAERLGATLIVVGARGEGGARRVLLGSVTRGLTERPSEAVAIIPELDGDAFGRRSMVVGVDGSDGSARAVRWAAESAQRAGAEVVAVHAFEAPISDATRAEVRSLLAEARARVEEEWCAPLRHADVAHRAVVEPGRADLVVGRVADSVRPGCIVAGTRGLGPISQQVLGSVTHRLVRESEWPVVVIPAPADRPTWPLP